MIEQSDKPSVDGLTSKLRKIAAWLKGKDWPMQDVIPVLKDSANELERLAALAGPLEQPSDQEKLLAFAQEQLAVADRQIIALREALASANSEQPQEPTSDKANLAQASGVCDLQTALPNGHTRYPFGWLFEGPEGLRQFSKSEDFIKPVLDMHKRMAAQLPDKYTITALVTAAQESPLSEVANLLRVMMGSAEVHSEGEAVTGYTIKTGALHRIIGVMQGAGLPIPLPSGLGLHHGKCCGRTSACYDERCPYARHDKAAHDWRVVPVVGPSSEPPRSDKPAASSESSVSVPKEQQ